MKILMLHPHDIFSPLEPWTVRIVHLASEFVKQGHEVKLVYFPLDPENNPKPSVVNGVETVPFNRSKWAIIKNILRLVSIAKWADVVHFQKCFDYAALPALFAAYLNNKPVHYDWDDWEYKIYSFSPPSKLVGMYLNFIEQLLPRLVDTISYSSEPIKKMALKFKKPEELFEAHVGADIQYFKPKKDYSIKKKYNVEGALVLYLGQLHGAQYAELFIRAAKLLYNDFPKARFMVVGAGSDLERLRALANNLGLNKAVIFTGAITHEQVPRYINAADVAVACFEDTEQTRCKSPLKVVEYLACGKVIVASDVGEVRKMLDGCGILTKPGDIRSLAQGIRVALRDTALRKSLPKKARKRAEEKYNWKVTAENLLKAYKYLLKKYKSK